MSTIPHYNPCSSDPGEGASIFSRRSPSPPDDWESRATAHTLEDTSFTVQLSQPQEGVTFSPLTTEQVDEVTTFSLVTSDLVTILQLV